MNRRKFIGAAAAISLTGRAMFPSSMLDHASLSGCNLVPDKPATAPNYWCTWAVQNYLYGQGKQPVDVAQLEGSSGATIAHNSMNEKVLLGAHGWASQFYSRIRKDLYLLLDDGWASGGTATFQLDPVKFSSFKGSPVERLRRLSRRIEDLEWRGLALWCRNTPGGEADLNFENLSKNAGVPYWKVDIGDQDFNLIRKRNEARIPLTLEHVQGEPPVNGDWSTDGRFGAQAWDSPRMRILRHTDVYRTYDVTAILSLPTTLDRTAEMLHAAAGHSEIHSLLNVEDEVYVAAVLGCTMGVMRHPLQKLRSAGDPDLFFNGTRNCKSRMDEVVRALHWQRIAQPYAAGTGSFLRSEEILRDGWKFKVGETWDAGLVGHTVWQGAPAVLARNMELPVVSSDREKPFVFTARFPNGAVAVGAQERTSPERAWYMPHSSVTINAGNAPGPFGVFGHYKSLTFEFLHAPSGKRVLAQDLAGNEALDITAMTSKVGNSVTINGDLLRRIGLLAGTSGDLSSPGAVVAFV